MRVLLVSTYDLGRQPFGLASPAAWLRDAGVDVTCVDTSRERLTDEQIEAAGLVAFYLPMHTATRLAAPLIDRVRRMNPQAQLAAYGLYAPINDEWLRGKGVMHVVGPEQGITQPGMVIVGGDSHTSTHGAFGNLAFGIGASEVAHTFATQTLWQKKPKAMRISHDALTEDMRAAGWQLVAVDVDALPYQYLATYRAP